MLDGAKLHAQDDLVDFSLQACEFSADRAGPGDVGGIVHRRFRARVVQEQLSLGKHVVIRVIVQDFAAHGNYRRKSLLPVAGKSDCLDNPRDFTLAFSRPGCGHTGTVHPIRNDESFLDLRNLDIRFDASLICDLFHQ